MGAQALAAVTEWRVLWMSDGFSPARPAQMSVRERDLRFGVGAGDVTDARGGQCRTHITTTGGYAPSFAGSTKCTFFKSAAAKRRSRELQRNVSCNESISPKYPNVPCRPFGAEFVPLSDAARLFGGMKFQKYFESEAKTLSVDEDFRKALVRYKILKKHIAIMDTAAVHARNAQPAEGECCICLEPFHFASHMITTRCAHSFHPTCLVRAVRRMHPDAGCSSGRDSAGPGRPGGCGFFATFSTAPEVTDGHGKVTAQSQLVTVTVAEPPRRRAESRRREVRLRGSAPVGASEGARQREGNERGRGSGRK